MDSRTSVQAKGLDKSESAREVDSTAISELIEQFVGFVRRQYPILVFVAACTLGLGLVYLFTAPARYTAHAMLLIDSSKMRLLQQQAMFGDNPLDTAQVETQAEVLRSEGIGLSVIKDLRLTDDPEFVGGGGGLLGVLFGLFGSASEVPNVESHSAGTALRVFLNNRTVKRVGLTYVLDIAFTSLNPQRAAQVANGIADAYIVDQLEAKYQATRRASTWLQERIADLRTQASAADRAVLDYKEKNKLVDVAVAPSPGSVNTSVRPLEEQQLAELSSQLSASRATSAEAKARLDRIQEVMKQDIPDASVADSLQSQVIIRLRGQYLDLSAREANWSSRYGAAHLAAVNLRNQMAELRHSINDELRRIAESQKSDYEIAKSREETLEQKINALIAETRSLSRDRLGLRELESRAQVYHTIYDNFLQRYMEAIQQQSFPITESRVISAADPPANKSSPQTFLVLAAAGLFGLLFGVAVAILRESTDNVFRSTQQVEDMLRVSCLAVVQAMQPTALRSGLDNANDITRIGKTAEAEAGSNVKKDDFFRRVVHEPLSPFAESMRSVKVAAEIGASLNDNKVIGITSTILGEGKSTVASNLAQLIAQSGNRVVLIDADMRNPSLTRTLAPNASVGLLEVLAGKIELRDAFQTDRETGLAFLPAVIKYRSVHTDEIVASRSFDQLIVRLRESYDYIILDFPPLAPVIDIRRTASFVDSYVYVIEWGVTNAKTVRRQLSIAPEVYERLIGVVLNKVNMRIFGRHEHRYSEYYNTEYYGRYGYTN